MLPSLVESGVLVFVVAYGAELVATIPRCLVEQLIVVGRQQRPVGGVAGVGVVDDTVGEREDGPPRPLGEAFLQVCSYRDRPLLEPVGGLSLEELLVGGLACHSSSVPIRSSVICLLVSVLVLVVAADPRRF
jgi:hypothetical protein